MKKVRGKGLFLRLAKESMRLIDIYKMSEKNIGLIVNERQAQFEDVFNSAKTLTPIRPKEIDK